MTQRDRHLSTPGAPRQAYTALPVDWSASLARRYGCHISQDVCPYNRTFSRGLADDSPFGPRAALAGEDARWLALDVRSTCARRALDVAARVLGGIQGLAASTGHRSSDHAPAMHQSRSIQVRWDEDAPRAARGGRDRARAPRVTEASVPCGVHSCAAGPPACLPTRMTRRSPVAAPSGGHRASSHSCVWAPRVSAP
ncbi:MAG: hypothetical protein AVDCRST_MAG40-3113 [uncultured Gemmatimonadaceae bacterium]|uniref:Uncharacterized protein n=1 Tax=uncultured Gemmatimonadaceae bacterium TaxID=246130 RepID=A0A6J4MD69_9BACT|nr:MAG: hypothetical protein AVDCRST_MAG40-3113 [uncultured Gemmatimonadaceae bacterium]